VDIDALIAQARTPFNLELAATDAMIAIATRLRPQQVTLVPERREEVTTEGGLDLFHDPARLEAAILALRAAGIRTALFIDPDARQVERAAALRVEAIELHTGRYCEEPNHAPYLTALRAAGAHAAALGLAVHAGHGLTLTNVGPVAAIPACEELNIGHAIIADAIFVGLPEAVRRMRAAMDAARRG
jgi:pyridoxine 5-phosphate synthase